MSGGAAAFHIRPLEPHDADEYRELRLRALRLNPEAFSASYEDEVQLPPKAFVERIARRPGVVLGGFSNGEGRLAGTATLFIPTGLKQRHRSNLFGVFVDPACRRSGLGRAIIQAAVEAARADGLLELVLLSVTIGNTSAERAYADLGFEAYGMVRGSLCVGERFYDERFMVLYLRDARLD